MTDDLKALKERTQKTAEVIFQMLVYGGAPVMVDGLRVAKRVLQERGEWKD
ncbi:MAG: hypothetical protein ACE5JN_03990 [Candidatus Methylomirabilia bacterium]